MSTKPEPDEGVVSCFKDQKETTIKSWRDRTSPHLSLNTNETPFQQSEQCRAPFFSLNLWHCGDWQMKQIRSIVRKYSVSMYWFSPVRKYLLSEKSAFAVERETFSFYQLHYKIYIKSPRNKVTGLLKRLNTSQSSVFFVKHTSMKALYQISADTRHIASRWNSKISGEDIINKNLPLPRRDAKR